MVDYGAYPFWLLDEVPAQNLSARELNASAGLTADLEAWANTYDETLDRDDPMSSGFATEQEHKEWVASGRELASRLQKELGEGFRIIYVDHITRRVEDVALG
jgi:hypothetical protein